MDVTRRFGGRSGWACVLVWFVWPAVGAASDLDGTKIQAFQQAAAEWKCPTRKSKEKPKEKCGNDDFDPRSFSRPELALAAWLAVPGEAETFQIQVAKKENITPPEGLTEQSSGNNPIIGPGVFDSPIVEQLSGFAVNALVALGKVLVDRARRVTLAWLLDRIGEDVCGYGKNRANATPEQMEIRRRWFREVCSVTQAAELTGYGSGASVLASLREAVGADLRQLPGVAAGYLSAALFFRECQQGDRSQRFDECLTPAAGACCAPVDRIRDAIESVATTLLRGGAILASLAQAGDVLEQAVRQTKKKSADRLPAPLSLAAGCLMGLPNAVLRYWNAIPKDLKVWNGTGPAPISDRQREQAALLAALVSTNACRALVVRGVSQENLKRLVTNPAGAKYISAWSVSSQLDAVESLSTLERIWASVVEPGYNLLAAIEALQEALKPAPQSPKSSAKALEVKQSVDLKGASPETARAAMDALAQVAAAEASASVRSERRTRALRVLRIAIAGLQVADAFLVLLDRMPVATGQAKPSKHRDPARVLSDAQMGRIRGGVRGARDLLSTAEAFLTEDYGVVVSRTIRFVRRFADENDHTHDVRLLRTFGKFASVLVDLQRAKTTDEMARVIDASAEPIDRYRDKSHDRRFMLTLTSHLGFISGGQTVFNRANGGRDLRATDWHYPAIYAPLGLDFSFGAGGFNHGPYVTVLELGGLLQFDDDGDIETPSPWSVLGIGVQYRFSLGDSPFSAGPFFVWRPNYREVDNDRVHVMHFGLAITVDLTLWTLYDNERN